MTRSPVTDVKHSDVSKLMNPGTERRQSMRGFDDDYVDIVDNEVAEWLAAGSGMVVVVNPRSQQVFVHLSPTEVNVLGVADTLDGGEVVSGWRLPIKELFER